MPLSGDFYALSLLYLRISSIFSLFRGLWTDRSPNPESAGPSWKMILLIIFNRSILRIR
uniref:Uncharacterized protein n=1 Tax=mine drainage metagenome TaxID=410659 RepID=E6QDH5_9ZZZZ